MSSQPISHERDLGRRQNVSPALSDEEENATVRAVCPRRTLACTVQTGKHFDLTARPEGRASCFSGCSGQRVRLALASTGRDGQSCRLHLWNQFGIACCGHGDSIQDDDNRPPLSIGNRVL